MSLQSSKLARRDFHRCMYCMMERLFGGEDINPRDDKLEANYMMFNFVFSLHRVGMIILAVLLLLNRH